MNRLDRDQLLAEVIRNIERPAANLAFTPALEEHYRTAIAGDRRRSMIVASGIGLGVLGSFVLLRAALGGGEPEAFRQWLTVMATIAGACVLTLATILASRNHRVIDRITMVALVGVAVMVCLSFRVDTGTVATAGIYCFAMVPLAAADLAPLHFRQAALVATISDVLHAVAVLTLPELDPPVHLPGLLLVTSVTAMSLWGNYRNDRAQRGLFLYLSRERLAGEISEERNAELRVMTTRDPLTGIPNRRGFEERFAAVLAGRQSTPTAIVMIDVDHFKAFNDRYGHVEGDRCLTAVARALTEELRGDGDFVARLGGEEFAAIVPGAEKRDLGVVLERLRRTVEKLAIPSGFGEAIPPGVVTVSLGCAPVPEAGITSRRELMEAADRALYEAKRGGRNTWRITETDTPSPVVDQAV